MNRLTIGMAACAVAGFLAQGAWAAEKDAAMESIDAYRQALQDGNPAELYELSGEELWSKAAGPKNAALSSCDLGLGAGVVKGANAQLPRYFKDTDKVQDLESRLLTCMETIQGIDTKPYITKGYKSQEKADLTALATFISGQSRDMPFQVKPTHPKEKTMYDLGERMFFFQGGPHDFSCATCHGGDGMRIRMQELPNITTPAGAASGMTSWPAYRVSNGQMWSMQHRINDCFRQQRMPEPIYASDVTIALSMYMAAKSNGATIQTPGIKR